ncbi:MAG: NAD(+) diphosphatase [Pseudomonas sp.]
MPNLLSQTLSGFAFVGAQLDRADHLRDDPVALAALWEAGHVLVLDEAGDAFADSDGGPLALSGADIGGGPGTAIFLGLHDGRGWFCVDAATVAMQVPGRIDLRRAAASWDARASGAFAYARGMSYWQARTRFCGVCGDAIAFRRGGFVGRCAQCGNEHYPRVDPAVIVAVEDGGRLLLGRQANWVPRRYSVIAGFVEPGESLEQTVAREVFEETRVRVAACRYLGSQPWPFPGALMLGFEAVAEPGQVPQVDGELEDARWFGRDEVGAAMARDARDDGAGIRLPPPISIARALIERWFHARD